jgi:diguanylate cyclase (GGDEF)-like protein/PAS domain S-box-containing protein
VAQPSTKEAGIGALRQEIAYVLQLIKMTHEAVLCIDEARHIVVINEGAERIFGYRAQEVVGRPLNDLIPERFRAAHDEHFRDFAASPEEAQLMHRRQRIHGLRRDNTEFPAEASIYKFSYGGAKTFVTVLRDVTEQAELERRLIFIAEHDYLTGLPNRILFNDRLATAITRARRHGESLALLYLDLNNFKQINDTLGHAAGDAFLQQVAQRLRACLRESDTIARLGGDEFAVVLEAMSAPGEAQELRRILHRALDRPIEFNDQTLMAAASIGFAIFPDDGSTADALMRSADQAMYREKRTRSEGAGGD